jgi:Icc-related predicted phosphoesterase
MKHKLDLPVLDVPTNCDKPYLFKYTNRQGEVIYLRAVPINPTNRENDSEPTDERR